MENWAEHQAECINRWEEYKNTSTKEEIIADMEEFFSLDKDGEISKLMAWVYYGITNF